MVFVQESISRRAHTRSSRCRWPSSTFYSAKLPELSTSKGFFLPSLRSSSLQPDQPTSQSQQSVHYTYTLKIVLLLQIYYFPAYSIVKALVKELLTRSTVHMPTLQIPSSESKMFLAARSLCTKPFVDKYCIPNAICWQYPNSFLGV